MSCYAPPGLGQGLARAGKRWTLSVLLAVLIGALLGWGVGSVVNIIYPAVDPVEWWEPMLLEDSIDIELSDCEKNRLEV